MTAGPGPATLRLSVALVATALVALLEFWGGAASRSLALTGDAVHVCMDVVALALALIAGVGAARPADTRRTFGYGRIEVLGALVNGTLLLVATIAIVYFAARRFAAPVEPQAGLMAAVAAVGLAVNAGVGLSLRSAGKSDLNVRAVLFHVMGDALGAFAVIFGGIAIALTHFAWIDPLLSLFVAAIIVVGVARLLRDATEVLLESVPGGVDSADLVKRFKAIAGSLAFTTCTCGRSAVARMRSPHTSCSTIVGSAKRPTCSGESTTAPKKTSASSTSRFNSNARAARSWCDIEGPLGATPPRARHRPLARWSVIPPRSPKAGMTPGPGRYRWIPCRVYVALRGASHSPLSH